MLIHSGVGCRLVNLADVLAALPLIQLANKMFLCSWSGLIFFRFASRVWCVPDESFDERKEKVQFSSKILIVGRKISIVICYLKQKRRRRRKCCKRWKETLWLEATFETTESPERSSKFASSDWKPSNPIWEQSLTTFLRAPPRHFTVDETLKSNFSVILSNYFPFYWP